MHRTKKDINWVQIMDSFSTYKGKIVDFCRDNNIRPQQLYRQRKKLNPVSTQAFHAIDVPKATASHSHDEEIKIEIGNAKIFLPAHDKDTLVSLLREIVKIC